jgi:PAS domain S-box-containing protein
MKKRQFSVLIAAAAPEDRAALRDALSRDPAARYVVIEAESGPRAIELCHARKPDCLILDHDLPDLSGLDALKKLVAEKEATDCAVVLLVGAGDARLAVEAMKSGAHNCLEKGRAQGAELRRAVKQAIEKAEHLRRIVARERELIEKNRALEAGLAVLQSEAAIRGRGEEVWQVARAGAGANGAVVSRSDGVFYDQTEEQLRLLKTAIAQSNESVVIMTAQLDPPGPQIVYVSPTFTKMTGYAPEEAIGRTPHILEGPKTDRSTLSQLCEDCMKGRVFHGETINYRKDRSEIRLEWTAGPVRNERGDVTHFASAQLDVTESRQVEDELRRSEEEFRTLFDLSAIGMTQVSPEGRYLRVNRKLCQMLGYSERELLQLTLHEVTHPDDREASAARLGSSFAGEPEEYSIEKRYVRKDGAIIWVLINWTVVRGPKGRPLRTVANIQDITERKQIEEALRTSEAQLRAILDHSVALIFVKDLEGRYLRVNRRYEELFGVTDAELTGKTDYDCHSKELADVFLANDREVIAANKPILFEEQALVDGEIRYSIVSKFPLRDGSGRPYAVCGIATDITERKRAETALRESQALNQAVLDSLAANIAVLDRNGNIIAVNDAWKRFGQENEGADIADSVGLNYLNVCRRALEQSNGELVETLEGLQAVLDGALSHFTVEYPCHSPDEKRWFLMSATPLPGGRGGAVVAHTNITERKQAEVEREELLAREQAARAEAEHAADSIRRLQAVTDSALARFALDDLLREMLSRIRELLETDSAVILLLTEDGQDLVVRATIGFESDVTGFRIPVGQGVAGSIAASRAPIIVEDLSAVEVINPILRQKARSLIGAPLIVEGRLIGVIHANMAQVRRFTEDDVRLLQLAADRVALAIEQTRLYEIERQARRQAEEANRMKDEFLALVSHELRSPLNAMLGYAALLRYGGLDAQKVKHAANVIERSGKAQAQLIDDLLDTARIISGKLRLAVGPVDLVSVIEEAIQTIHPAAAAKGISLNANLPPAIGQITGDPARLQQVVWNLLSNAVKFTPQGGRIEARLERVDPHIRISVSDTGKGISPDFLPYVFDRFRQSDVSSARRYGGLGLGLALVKYLVELHGGTVEAASAGEGQGATFNVTLPVRAVVTPIGEDRGAPVTVKRSEELSGVRALVVDDEDDARELVKAALAQHGADVVAVRSAAEAYELITATPPQERPDVMVSDIGMPGEDGYSLLRRVREWERASDFYTPAVALTAYGRSEDRVRALQAGFQTHIAKPVDPAELAIVIENLIRRLNGREKR